MANLLNQNPIVLTEPQNSFKTAVASALGKMFTLQVVRVSWYNAQAIGDEAVLIDPVSGYEWVRLQCKQVYFPYVADVNRIWSDFALTQLDSGYLKIDLK